MITIATKPTTLHTPHWDAELYKKNSILLQQTSALDLIKKLDINQYEHILDIGCGDGKISAHLANIALSGSVEGFDLSQEMIHLARSEFKNCTNLFLSVGNAESFNYEKQFDWVMSFFCLQWVTDKKKTFKQIFKHLKPNGNIAIITTDRNPYLLQKRHTLIQKNEFKEYFIGYIDSTNVIDDDDYQNYAIDAGFNEIEYTQSQKTIFFENELHLKVFIKMVTPALKLIPSEELKESFLNQLMEGYLCIVPEIEGTKNNITYTIKTLLAKK